MAHKVPRKSTSIDMTAMCDVAFLLLTFFMLATKFKPAEPVAIRTPNSVADIVLPDNAILITLDKEGKIYLDYDNKDAKQTLIDKANKERNLNLTEEDKKQFVSGSAIGSNFATMHDYFALDNEARKNFPSRGIPCDTTASPETNELAYWIYNARIEGTNSKIGKQPIICIKSDAGLAYPGFKNLVTMLTKNEIYTFNLLTGAQGVPEGTALYEERIMGSNKK
jgi:biopolymer transport protein ExbD